MVLIAVLSHFIADFILQPSFIIHEKRSKLILGNLLHAIIVFCTYMVVCGYFSVYQLDSLISLLLIFKVSLSLSIAHFLIDIVKTVVLLKIKDLKKWDLRIFIIDQFLHILSIIVLFKVIEDFISLNDRLENIVKIIILYIVTIIVGDYIIQKILKSIKSNIYTIREVEIKGIGSLIGKIERTIIFTMLIFNHPEIAIAVIGVKSIARFPELNKAEETNDYFILGNLLSFLIVIIGYVLYRII